MVTCSKRRLDLTGQRFGKLTAIKPAEDIRSQTAWLCRCDCGQEIIVTTSLLRDGRRTSCGCDKPMGAAGRASLTYVDGTCVEMIRASTKRGNNTSGVPGVDWLMKKQRWRATLCFKGKRHYLGSYVDFEDAVKARREAEVYYYENFLHEFAAASQVKAGADSNID